jgi:hypothetical protein
MTTRPAGSQLTRRKRVEQCLEPAVTPEDLIYGRLIGAAINI